MVTETYEELRQIARDHFWPHSQQVSEFDNEGGLQVITKGEGVWVEDVNGNRYIDVLSGMWLVNIGYGRKEVAQAAAEQIGTVNYSPENTTNIPALRLSKKVAELSKDPKSRVFFVSGGSEAVETALQMARRYHAIRGEPGRFKFISRKDSYHGATFGCMGLGGYRGTSEFGPLVPGGNVHVTQPYPYRCQYCSDKGGCNLECAKDVERAIDHEGKDTVAALIGEPISTVSMQAPHKDYWPMIREICDKNGVLLIADEVITGFGRTGKMFGQEHWDYIPDITTMAKGLSSGYVPIGATMARKEIADEFIGGEEKTFNHLFTFGGHPGATAAALKNLEIMEGEGMIENSANMGQYLYDQLQTLYEHPIVGNVTGGTGLLASVELVKDRDTKEKFPKELKLGDKLTEGFLKRGLLTRQRGEMIFLSPPLCITRDEVDHIVKGLDESIADAAATLE